MPQAADEQPCQPIGSGLEVAADEAGVEPCRRPGLPAEAAGPDRPANAYTRTGFKMTSTTSSSTSSVISGHRGESV